MVYRPSLLLCVVYQIILAAAIMISTNWRLSTAQAPYSIAATWVDDPEEFWTVAYDEKRWTYLTDGAENLGLLFTGKSEFPWIVDIRVERKNQEYWSTGNLIKKDTVLTTCRAIDDLGDINTGKDTPRVTFAQLYLFEYTFRRDPPGHNWLLGGTRNVLEAKKHKKCNVQKHYYDGGLLILTNPIIPAPPTISTVQLTYNYREGLLSDFDLSKMMDQRRICYIASFGRDYANIRNTLVADFKVKYRVYWEPPSLCYPYSVRMCPNRFIKDVFNCLYGSLNPDDKGRELMCMKSRAKVGAVCDHDKGAPLVCDGKVTGLVILGAKERFCNDLLPLPFWVQKITIFEDYFEPPKEGGTRNALGVQSKTHSFASLAMSLQKSNGIRRFILIQMSVFCFGAIS